jgi:molybdate transport system ATP-binding protein
MTEDASIHVCFRGNLGRFQLDAAFEVPARGVTALFGPSGCGKTTVLRCMAGLTHLRDGYCSIAGDIWQDGALFRPVHERRLGYVFQEASLFSHLSVKKNLLYGAPKYTSLHTIRFDEVVDLLAIGELLERSPRNLSGGERQRVAIGRALLSQPRILLMDEPLSALDKLTKDEILPFLERLHESLDLPVIYVSHDMSEIERLSDQLVLMESGRVLAIGPISHLQSDPNLPLLRSRDAAVSLDARVEAFDAPDGMATLAVAGGRFLVPSGSAQPGDHQRLRILAGDVSLAREPPNQSTIVNILRARILSAEETGDHQMTAVLGLGESGDGARLLSRVTRRSWRLLELAPGLNVYAQVKGVALVRQRGAGR